MSQKKRLGQNFVFINLMSKKNGLNKEVKKNFGSRKILGPKNYLDQKNLVFKSVWVNNSSIQKEFWSTEFKAAKNLSP